jgi:hypothetical protein
VTQPAVDFGAMQGAIGALTAGAPVTALHPRIDVNRQMSEVVSDGVRALVLHNQVAPTVFRSGGRLARVTRETDDNGTDIIIIRPYNAGALRGHLSRVAHWVYVGQQGDGDRPPPREVVDDLLGNSDIFTEIPVLRQVVHCPLFSSEGVLHAKPGYSTATHCWYEPRGDLKLSEIPHEPAPEQVAQARDLLLNEYLGDFPFEEQADRTHALALTLLPFIRPMISGPTPLHLIEASTPGTGKGLLGRSIFLLSHGADIPSMTECRDDTEWTKSLTAKFTTGQQVIFIDNVSRTLKSAKLAAALTQSIWEDRLLGGSRMLIIPVRHVFVATGNNVSMSGELARRTVRCRLNAHVEQPWMRGGFKHADLVTWGTEHRSHLVRAVIILVTAWLRAGRPAWSGKPLGSYEDWSRILGGIMDVAELPGFLTNLQKFYDASVDEADDERPLVMAWYEEFGEQEVLARDLVQVAAKSDSAGGNSIEVLLEKQTPKALAKRLRSLDGRVFGDLEVVHIPKKGKPDKYRLVKAKPDPQILEQLQVGVAESVESSDE